MQHTACVDTPRAGALSLSGLLDRAAQTARGDELRLERFLGAFEDAGFAALVFVPAAAVVTPLSGIPLFSSICGLTIALLSAQWLVGRRQPWLPRFLARRKIPGDKARKAIDGLRPAAAWLDRHARTRGQILFRRPQRSLLPLACLVFGLSMPPLELVPFSSSLLGAATCLVAFSRMTRDGLYALIALLPPLGLLWIVGAMVGPAA